MLKTLALILFTVISSQQLCASEPRVDTLLVYSRSANVDALTIELSKAGADVILSIPKLNALFLKYPSRDLKRLRSIKGVEHVEDNYERKAI